MLSAVQGSTVKDETRKEAAQGSSLGRQHMPDPASSKTKERPFEAELTAGK
jgi:hypothetical protein